MVAVTTSTRVAAARMSPAAKTMTAATEAMSSASASAETAASSEAGRIIVPAAEDVEAAAGWIRLAIRSREGIRRRPAESATAKAGPRRPIGLCWSNESRAAAAAITLWRAHAEP